MLQSTDYLMCNTNKDRNEDVPLVNRMIRVCVALVNLCPPIIPFDWAMVFVPETLTENYVMKSWSIKQNYYYRLDE